MSTLRLMHAKLHRFQVTQARQHYVGSVTVDIELMERVGLLPLEEVEIVNVENGARWSTYVLPGERGSGIISPNGGGALLCAVGDLLILFAYALRERDEVVREGHVARVAIGGPGNGCAQYLEQRLAPTAGGVAFASEAPIEPNDFSHRAALAIGGPR